MYSEEQKAKALCIYHRIGSVTDTVRRLGYPSREHLYTWIRNEGTTKEKRKRLNLKNTTEHPRNPPAEFKFEVLRRCFENGESVKSLSEEIGYSRASIYTGDNQRIKKRPRRRLEEPEEQGEGSGDRRHEREVSATGPASKDETVKE